MVYLDEAAHYRNPTTKLLASQEQEKNKKHKEAAKAKGREFIPFVVTTDGVIGKEGRKLLSKIGTRLASRWKKDSSLVMGYVRTKISVAIAKATSACIRGERGARGLARGFEDGAALASILS